MSELNHYFYVVIDGEYVSICRNEELKVHKRWIKVQTEIWSKYEGVQFLDKYQTEAEHELQMKTKEGII